MPDPDHELLGRASISLRSDAVGAIGRRALAQADIRCVVLKGRAFATLLYDRSGERIYRDTDLLISLGDLAQAGHALTAAGFQRPRSDHLDLPPHYAQFWIHQETGGAIDLHWSLDGPTQSPARVWREMLSASVSATIADEPALVLDPAGTAFLCALHAARHGPRFEGPLEDLRRAVARLSPETWSGAHALARRLGAEEPFGYGLGLVDEGRALAGQLGLTITGTHEGWLKAQNDSALWSALLVEKIVRSGSLRAAVVETARWMFPPPQAMRVRYPIAAGSRLKLAGAYLHRIATLPPRSAGALMTWWSTKRKARKNG